MARYILKRLLLIIPTLWAIITVNFFIVQIAPGGPVDQAIANMSGLGPGGPMERISGGSGDIGAGTGGGGHGDSRNGASTYRGSRGLDPEVIDAIKKRYGFDKPILVRYFDMIGRYLTFDLGDSLFKGNSVTGLILERMPVSISLGLWSTLIIYVVSIPLGIRKAVKNGSRFDVWTSSAIVVGNMIPTFLFAIILIVLFSGGSFLKIFPLRGLISDNFADLSLAGKVGDYFWHIFLPVLAEVIGGFATLTMLTKNSFLDEIGKQYVTTARAKGLTEKAILRKHVFRNAMLLVIAGFPATFISMFFTGSVLIEVIFSLNGLGLLGFEATMQRDYPVMFGTLYIFTLLGLLLSLLSDITYTLVDPRIDFERRQA
jgi:microcin C transport system permease protein